MENELMQNVHMFRNCVVQMLLPEILICLKQYFASFNTINN